MNSVAEVMDIMEALLQPIDDLAQVGPYLRYDPIYDRIAQARRRENQSLPQGVWQRPVLQADWELVESLCTETILRRSKDMQLAVWRAEALLHLHGLRGYSNGCQLIHGLHQQFALTMHPAPTQALEEDTSALPLPANDAGVEHRLNIVAWMNEKLSVEMKLLPITAPDELSGLAAFSLADLEGARLRDQAQQHVPGGLKAAESRVKQFDSSLAMTSEDWLLELWSDLQQAAEATAAMDEIFDLCYGRANGGLLQLKEVLEQMAAAIAPALPEEIEVAPEEIVEYPGALEIAAAAEKGGHSLPSAYPETSETSSSLRAADFTVRTREEAYRRLDEISDFLARIEPHSPVPYLLRRAIAWGGMSLQELLPELLHDPAALKDVNHMLRLNGGNGSSNLK